MDQRTRALSPARGGDRRGRRRDPGQNWGRGDVQCGRGRSRLAGAGPGLSRSQCGTSVFTEDPGLHIRPILGLVPTRSLAAAPVKSRLPPQPRPCHGSARATGAVAEQPEAVHLEGTGGGPGGDSRGGGGRDTAKTPGRQSSRLLLPPSSCQWPRRDVLVTQ